MEIFAKRAMGYCSGFDQQQFEANPLVQDAVLRNIELIGEAAAVFLMNFDKPIPRFSGVRSSPCATN